MFTDKLYDHKFDIDDVLRALCGDDHTGRWLLNSRTKELVQETPESATTTWQDGDDNNHVHIIEPLPVSYLHELRQSLKNAKLTDNERQHTATLLDTCTSMYDVYALFPQHERVGAWLREQIKKTALEWLDERQMVPPSMKHVYQPDARDYAVRKVTIAS